VWMFLKSNGLKDQNKKAQSFPGLLLF